MKTCGYCHSVGVCSSFVNLFIGILQVCSYYLKIICRYHVFKVDLLLDKLSAFEILDEELEEQEGWNPYETEAEEYENYDDDNPETD